MAVYVDLNGFENFSSYTEKIDPNGPPVLFFFKGSKLPNGSSWCPDCVEGDYNEFNNYISKIEEDKPNLFFFFTGKKKENGRSWCIYCQIAEPVVKSFLGELKSNLIFAYVDVGDRDYWKDRACPFRTDTRTKLMVIPTIIKWKGVQRLEGSQCSNRELLQMLLEEEE